MSFTLCSIHFLHWFESKYFWKLFHAKLQPLSHIFESGMKISSINMSWHKTKVFNPQTWDSCLRHESWQVYIKEKLCRCSMEGIYTKHSHCLAMGNFLWFHTHKETSKRQELQKHENLILKTVVIWVFYEWRTFTAELLQNTWF